MPDDGDILANYASGGEARSLAPLVVRHSRWMSALLRGMLPDADVEDALQDAWLKIFRSAGKFRGGSVKSYFGSIARSVAVDCLRKRGRLARLEDKTEDALALSEPADDAPSPSERFESSATKEDVLRAVRALPEGPRQVLLLRIEAEMTFREIAETLNVPLGTALTWMRSATHALKRQLGEER